MDGSDAARRQGLVLVLLSAASYAALPIFAKYAYAAGLEPLDLLAWRFLLATPLVWLLLFLRGRRPERSTLPRAPLLGAGVLFGVTAATAFLALARIPSSLYTVLLYTYPALVALVALALGEPLARRGWAALGLTLLGILLTVPQLGSVLDGADALGIGLGLLNALLYACYIHLSNRLLRGQQALAEASAWSISGSLLLLVVVALMQGLTAPVGLAAWASVVGLAAVSTVIPIFTFLAGMQKLGASRAAIASTVEPLLTILLATVLLGERLQPRQWLGGALILCSVLVLQLPRRRARPVRVLATPLLPDGELPQER